MNNQNISINNFPSLEGSVSIYEKNFRLLEKLGVIPLITKRLQHAQTKGTGLDLHYDLLIEEKDFVTFALSQYYKTSTGDMVPDPDLQLRIFPAHNMVEALAFQNSMVYQEVYNPDFTRFNPMIKKRLNKFLTHYLQSLLKMDFKFKEV